MILKKRAFTLFEIVMVVAIIGILTLGMTAYMGNSGEKAKIIEAQGCANAIGGVLKNYVYNALTSKSLKTGDNYISPDYYYINLITGSSNDCFKDNILIHDDNSFCYGIRLGLSTGTLPPSSALDIKNNIKLYQTINTDNTCHQGKIKLGYYRDFGKEENNFGYYILMNKGFTQKEINEKKVFYIQNTNYLSNPNKLLIGDIVIVLCYDKECESWKHIGRRHIDARSQTIEFQKCKFYKDDDPTLCKTREDELDDEE